jgi:acyl carrier protein
LTIQLPTEPETIPRFLRHVWVFDHLRATEEDRKRTKLYQENRERERFRQEVFSLSEFLLGLQLQVRISDARPDHFARIAQLTERTNQFNFTTIRRSEAELRRLCESGEMDCLKVEVSDRFGDYGLVGAVLFSCEPSFLKVDTFLLSCRVLGRGVEHRMVAKLGELAQDRGLSHLQVPYVRTRKNQPALDFLEGVGAGYKEDLSGGTLFNFPADCARAVVYVPMDESLPGNRELEVKQASGPKTAGQETASVQTKSEVYSQIANVLYDAEEIARAIQSQRWKARPDQTSEYVAPRNETERLICEIWGEVLGIDKIGVNDNFRDVGGQSLLAIRIISRVEKEAGVRIPVRYMFDAPTVASISGYVETARFVKRGKSRVASDEVGEREVIEF